MSHIGMKSARVGDLERDRFRDESLGAAQVAAKGARTRSVHEDELEGYAVLARPMGYDPDTGRARTLFDVAARVARSVARTYPGVDDSEIESRTLARVARGLVRAPMGYEPCSGCSVCRKRETRCSPNEVRARRVSGRAYIGAHRVARRMPTGRGSMPIVFDGERMPGTPNYSLWVGLDSDGKPVSPGKAGKSASWLASHYRLPGQIDLVAESARVNDAQAHAAFCAVLANCETGSRGRGVIVRWNDAYSQWSAVLADAPSFRTFRRIAKGAVLAATNAENVRDPMAGRGPTLAPTPTTTRDLLGRRGGWIEGKGTTRHRPLAAHQRDLASRETRTDTSRSDDRWREVLAICRMREQGTWGTPALPAPTSDLARSVASASDSWAREG